jgi:predicted Zn-dependent peptidase
VTLRTTTLDQGVIIVTEAMRDVRSVSLGFWVGTGSVDEAPAEAGASHFLEHLLFKGTAERSARSIAEAVDSVGGDLNAFTTKEYTAFYVRLLADDLDLGVGLLSDIFWAPAFRPEELESERQVILEEILMHGDEPADLVHDVLTEAMFPDHPLGREVMGDQATVSAMDVARISAFHERHYRPANLVVAAAGKLDHDQVVSGIASRLPSCVPGGRPVRQAPEGRRQPRSVLARQTEQVHLAVGVPGPSRNDEDRHALAVAEHVLGGGMSSRLFQTVREERGLAYSIYSYRAGFEHAGTISAYAGTAPSHGGEVVDLIEDAFASIAQRGITEDELGTARGHMLGSLALGLEDSGARMSRIGYSQLVHERVLELHEVEERLHSLTLDGVNEAASRWMSAEPTVAIIGPLDSSAAGRGLGGRRWSGNG